MRYLELRSHRLWNADRKEPFLSQAIAQKEINRVILQETHRVRWKYQPWSERPHQEDAGFWSERKNELRGTICSPLAQGEARLPVRVAARWSTEAGSRPIIAEKYQDPNRKVVYSVKLPNNFSLHLGWVPPQLFLKQHHHLAKRSPTPHRSGSLQCSSHIPSPRSHPRKRRPKHKIRKVDSAQRRAHHHSSWLHAVERHTKLADELVHQEAPGFCGKK